MIRRLVAGAALAVLAVVLTSSPAAADPPRPTDYRTVVDAIEPPVPGLVVQMIGGDSLLELRAPTGRAVAVIGYRGEEFLRFHPDGRVEEDHASYTYRTSQSRYGSAVDAEQTDATDWRTVSTSGTWAWHDHRSHLMTTQRPLGRSPGDQVSAGVVPLVVDGAPVRVQLSTFWMEPPSKLPALAGALLAAVLLVLLVLLGRGRLGGASWAILLVLAAGLAAIVGGTTVRARPAHVGGPIVEWAFPLLALGLAGAALVLRRRPGLVHAALVLAALALLEWGWLRRTVLTKALLPTTMSMPLDRALTAAVLVVAAGTLVRATWLVVAEQRRPAPVVGP